MYICNSHGFLFCLWKNNDNLAVPFLSGSLSDVTQDIIVYDFEYKIKSELSQFKFYCLVINDGCLFSPQIDSNH